jgi:hypothetical protein
MSSREFTELRGISGVATAARAAIIPNMEKRKLIWWLQGRSLAEGGLRKVTEDLLAMFPERIGTPSMHKTGMRRGQNITAKEMSVAEQALGGRGGEMDEELRPEPADALFAYCEDLARDGDQSREGFRDIRTGAFSIEEFIIDICINPLVQIRTASEGGRVDSAESDLVKNRYRDLSPGDFKAAELPYFKDIIGALIEYKRRHEKGVKEGFVLTAIGRKIWETLDFALATGNMVLLDGLEGRGKTEAIKAWCELHLGEARFVSLKGITSKTTAFREIAKALGIASSYSRTAPEMQARIEDVLQRSKLMLVVDESHFAFSQSQRIYSRPELIDWIDTAIANRKVPIALVSTPQFMVCMTRAASQVDWNFRQFRRRVRRYVKLPAKNTPRDIEAVIRRVLPGAPNSAVKQVLSYVHLTRRDLSAVGDVVDEIKAMQGRNELAKVTYEEVIQVIDEHLVPSEKNFIEAITEAESKASPGRTKRGRPVAATSAESDGEEFGSEPASEGLSANENERGLRGNVHSAAPLRFDDTLTTV